jgi:GntR family transcriptional regulator/MocR family aminotransferase
VYAGTTSKTLAPALRLGWLVIPARLVEPVQQQQKVVDFGAPRIEQHAFADFLSRGELDRHLRRMRGRYKARRDVLVATLRAELPEARVHGIRAGLHATIELPEGVNARKVQAGAARRGLAFTLLSDYYTKPTAVTGMIVLGYGRGSEPSVRAGIKLLGAVIRELRGSR